MPTFPNPYLQRSWSAIRHFTFDTDLHLMRGIAAVQGRHGRDADYVLAAPYRVSFVLDHQPLSIEVPAGLITDLSSVPRAVWSMTGIGRVGPHLEASIVHDFLYIAWQDLDDHRPTDADRRFADEILMAGMECAGVGWVDRQLIYGAVRTFGGAAFFGSDGSRWVEDNR